MNIYIQIYEYIHIYICIYIFVYTYMHVHWNTMFWWEYMDSKITQNTRKYILRRATKLPISQKFATDAANKNRASRGFFWRESLKKKMRTFTYFLPGTLKSWTVGLFAKISEACTWWISRNYQGPTLVFWEQVEIVNLSNHHIGTRVGPWKLYTNVDLGNFTTAEINKIMSHIYIRTYPESNMHTHTHTYIPAARDTRVDRNVETEIGGVAEGREVVILEP